ncbi:NUDIX domain-containing protein [Lentzea albidocapillata subsp. violacea]|uniref:NUDIX domain-containing protein n=1 Tax=Lentzea albidocapillata subsp. violacea TaxID=128104 RepID=A0A1G8Z936_9PSEU|nr:NUDIX domain-containing protein [Lentzea albidocapillata]SDK11154.1 NUDIX domain-containing protein [Lentzea albidocapillata subsp. violacea]
MINLYDEAANVVGEVTRERMRAENLWHGCATIVVLSLNGERVYVHRRTDIKDIFPGLYDCTAGGVIDAGETPGEAAVRELREELGAETPLTFLFQTTYVDERTRYHAWIYETRSDGPFTHQPEEVAWGGWMSLDELRGKIEDPGWPLVPDGRVVAQEWLRRTSSR